MVTSALGDNKVDEMSNQLGEDKANTMSALTNAIPLIVGAMARNTKSDEGAQALNGALERDHDGSILDNLGGLISNPDQGAGSGILKHVLGQKQPVAQEAVAKQSGISLESAGKVMTMAAPIIMGMLGKKKREQGLGVGDIAGMLAGASATTEQSSGMGGMITGLLDRDGDGSVMDDIGGMIGGLFGGKK